VSPSHRRRPSPEPAEDLLRSLGYLTGPLLDDGWGSWWLLAQHVSGWVLLTVPDPALYRYPEYVPHDFPRGESVDEAFVRIVMGPYRDVATLITAIMVARRTTAIAGQWERRAANLYLDSRPGDEREALAARLATEDPDGWETLEGLRRYEANLAVKGRQAESVRLLKETLQRLWPQTMTPNRLTQFGRRHADEVFMILPYDTWADRAEEVVERAAGDPDTSTEDTIRLLTQGRPLS
jgi:hypothetical protein